jgi:hypothetical protein
MTPHRLAAYASMAVVVTAIAVGLYFSGSPAEQRLVRFDERRVEDLRSLASALSRHVVDTGALPERLEALVDGRRLTRTPRDPATGEPYEYTITGQRAFALCAEFSRPSQDELREDFWAHGQGRTCFAFDYSQLLPSGPALR